MVPEVEVLDSPGEIVLTILEPTGGYERLRLSKANAAPGEVKWLDDLLAKAKEYKYASHEDTAAGVVTIQCPKGVAATLVREALDIRIRGGGALFALDKDGKPLFSVTGRKAREYVERAFAGVAPPPDTLTTEEKRVTKVVTTAPARGG